MSNQELYAKIKANFDEIAEHAQDVNSDDSALDAITAIDYIQDLIDNIRLLDQQIDDNNTHDNL